MPIGAGGEGFWLKPNMDRITHIHRSTPTFILVHLDLQSDPNAVHFSYRKLCTGNTVVC